MIPLSCFGGVFQSTLPARGATMGAAAVAPRSQIFQSTLPARGATSATFPNTSTLGISIHAPRTGSDGVKNNSCYNEHISIHAPRTGSDVLCCLRRGKLQAISIHAPRTGSDGIDCAFGGHNQISIHAPRTGSDRSGCWISRAKEPFQSTLPARGATRFIAEHPRAVHDFNPRSPHGERPGHGALRHRRAGISIHAPRTGSDGGIQHFVPAIAISIHAPRTGSD